MRRFTVLMTVAFAAAATGCIYEREAVRDDRRVEAPPPAPADTYPPAANPDYQSYQSEAQPPPPAGTEVSSVSQGLAASSGSVIALPTSCRQGKVGFS